MKAHPNPVPRTATPEPDDGWFKAHDSDSGGNCVQIKFDGNTVKIRDSKDPTGPWLTFTRAEFNSFKHGIRNGEFDR